MLFAGMRKYATVVHFYKVSNDIYQRILSKEIAWSSDSKELLGNKEFTDDE